MSKEDSRSDSGSESENEDRFDEKVVEKLIIPDEVTSNLREFIDLCEQIKGAKEENKILRDRKSELETAITAFMIDNSIPAFKTPNGKIQVYNTKSVKPLSRDFLRDTMASRILDEKIVQELTEMAFAKRPTASVQKIKVIPPKIRRD